MAQPRRTPPYRRILDAENRLEAIRETDDDSLLEALLAAARSPEGLLSNVLEEELATRLSRVRRIASTLPEGLLVLDADAHITHLNAGAARLFGVSRAEAQGRLPMELIDRLDADGNVMPAAEWTASRSLAEGRVLHDEAWFRRRSDGALFSSAFVLTPLVHDGRVLGAVALFNDTTLRKAADDEAHAELKALAAIARHTPDMLTRSEPDGRIFWASPATTAVLGYAPTELLGRRLVELAHEDDAEHLQQMRRIASEPQMPPVEVIYRIVHKSGEHVWVHSRFQGATDPASGELKEMIASTRPLYPRARIGLAEPDAPRRPRADRD